MTTPSLSRAFTTAATVNGIVLRANDSKNSAIQTAGHYLPWRDPHLARAVRAAEQAYQDVVTAAKRLNALAESDTASDEEVEALYRAARKGETAAWDAYEEVCRLKDL